MKIKNLNDARAFSQGGPTKIVLFAAPGVLCFVLNLMPGQRIPGHSHEDSDLVLTVLGGRGRADAGGESVALEPGAILHIEGREMFGIPEVGENLSLLAVLSPNPENPEYSAEINT